MIGSNAMIAKTVIANLAAAKKAYLAEEFDDYQLYMGVAMSLMETLGIDPHKSGAGSKLVNVMINQYVDELENHFEHVCAAQLVLAI